MSKYVKYIKRITLEVDHILLLFVVQILLKLKMSMFLLGSPNEVTKIGCSHFPILRAMNSHVAKWIPGI